MKIMSLHRGQITVLNDTKHESVCLSDTEKNKHATYFPNGSRISLFILFRILCNVLNSWTDFVHITNQSSRNRFHYFGIVSKIRNESVLDFCAHFFLKVADRKCFVNGCEIGTHCRTFDLFKVDAVKTRL